MRKTLILIATVCVLVLFLGSQCLTTIPDADELSIVDTWLIDDTVLYYLDTTESTGNNIVYQTMTLLEDGTLTASGTSAMAGDLERTVALSGTYTHDPSAATLDVVYETFEMDGQTQTPPTVPTLDCAITDTTMTLTWPADNPQPYSPAEALIYARQ